MRKIWVIAQRELYETYTDSSLLVIMLVTPLALATIIGLALGGGGDDAPIQDIPMAIVNQDEGETGGIIVNAFLPEEGTAPSELGDGQTCDTATADNGETQMSLQQLTNPVLLDSVDEARAGVSDDTYAAAVIIPPDFSENITYSQANSSLSPVEIDVIANPGAPVSSTIVRGVVDGIATQIITGSVTVAATIETLIEHAQTHLAFGLNFGMLSLMDEFQPNFACAFDPNYAVIELDQQTLTGEEAEYSPLVYFGAANAMFFVLFTAQGGATSILEDQRQGVLQRMIVSPTSEITILLGKLVGTFITSLVQLLLLFIAFTVVGSLFNGELTLIWGRNIPLITAVILTAALSASGLGTILAALARSPEQANVIGSTINITMAVLGGAFFQVSAIPALRPLQSVSIVYWGTDAFTKLATGSSEVLLNMAVLALQGGLMFLFGLWLFNRRFDV